MAGKIYITRDSNLKTQITPRSSSRGTRYLDVVPYLNMVENSPHTTSKWPVDDVISKGHIGVMPGNTYIPRQRCRCGCGDVMYNLWELGRTGKRDLTDRFVFWSTIGLSNVSFLLLFALSLRETAKLPQEAIFGDHGKSP